MTDTVPIPTRTPISSGAVWCTDDVGPPETWTYEFDDAMRDAIVDAVARTRARSITLASATRADFALAELAPFHDTRTRDLNEGRVR